MGFDAKGPAGWLQNIAEDSRAADTSSKSELHLTNVARSSLEELLLDYENYLRHRFLPQWDPDSPEAGEVRGVPARFINNRSNPSDQTDLNPPACPQCGALMVLRTAKNTGSQF